ncbi:MAG: hypothetical protein HYX29_08135 [Solirubrobacterales bacterium]|nr:hypothetical protein [Solirubrobacterales bacterium]
MKPSPENRFVKSLDLVVDFATLGEYRVITDFPRRKVRSRDIWATDIEWSSRPRQREIECSLPRARDRALARERVRG